jgi:hypothetical protein
MRAACDRPLPVRLLSLILIFTQLGGCVSWHTQHGATEQLLARRAPDRGSLAVVAGTAVFVTLGAAISASD